MPAEVLAVEDASETRERYAGVLKAMQIPVGAVAAWLALQTALKRMQPESPVCVADPEMWWPSGRRQRSAEAVEWCGGCPVRAECLAYAVAAGEPSGIWGGSTSIERGAGRRGEGRRP